MKKNSSVLILVVIIAIVFSIVCFWGLWKDQGLRKRFKLETALVDSISRIPRAPGVWVFYRFELSQKSYRKKQDKFLESDSLASIKRLLLNQYMPIVYDSLDPSNSEVLLFSKDFARYGLQRPDSLAEIVKTIDRLEE